MSSCEQNHDDHALQPLTPLQAERFLDLYNRYAEGMLRHAAEVIGPDRAVEIVAEVFKAARNPHNKVLDYLESPRYKPYYHGREWLTASLHARLNRELRRDKAKLFHIPQDTTVIYTASQEEPSPPIAFSARELASSPKPADAPAGDLSPEEKEIHDHPNIA